MNEYPHLPQKEIPGLVVLEPRANLAKLWVEAYSSSFGGNTNKQITPEHHDPLLIIQLTSCPENLIPIYKQELGRHLQATLLVQQRKPELIESGQIPSVLWVSQDDQPQVLQTNSMFPAEQRGRAPITRIAGLSPKSRAEFYNSLAVLLGELGSLGIYPSGIRDSLSINKQLSPTGDMNLCKPALWWLGKSNLSYQNQGIDPTQKRNSTVESFTSVVSLIEALSTSKVDPESLAMAENRLQGLLQQS